MTTKKLMMEEIQKMEEKYSRLVWYARKTPENYRIAAVKESMTEIQKLYSEEVEQLTSDNSDWFHGFNSGMLAAMRFIQSMEQENIETAKENFPELDS
jgi:hypothetical protein